MWRRGLLRALLTVAAVIPPLSFGAEKPVLEHIFPAGIQRGITNTFTLFGKFEAWPPKAWSSAAALSFDFTTNKGMVRISVPADAPAGAGFIRLYNDEGPSDPVIFVIGDGPEIQETEPNNHFRKAQTITNLPVLVNGRLDKNGDVDSFSFPVRAGDWLDARLDCYTLLSKIDAVLRLLDADGHQLAWNHDFATLDPRLIWRAARDQTVVLQVFGFVYPANAEIALSGGSGGGYRLHLNRSDCAPSDVFWEKTEHEPNNNATNSLELTFGGEILGSICPRGDEDRYRINLKKDEIIEASIDAAAFGSPLDAWLKIEDAAGKELARNDDAENSRDPRLEWKAPADAIYYLAIGSLTHQGSEEARYRLSVKKLEPDYRANLAANSLVLTTGSTNEIKFNFKRLRGFTNELSAVLEKLPDGITLGKVTVPVADGDGIIQLISATNAPAFNGPLTLALVENSTKQTRKVPFELVSRSENNGVPGGYTKLLAERLEELWLTVKTADAAKASK